MDGQHTRLAAFVLLTIAVVGCNQQADRSGVNQTGVDQTGQVGEVAAFALPAGDAVAGQATFVKLRCYDCHEIPGVDLPFGEELDQVRVLLGGESAGATTYDELVTSIINPSHRISAKYTESLVASGGVSNMTNYNDAMTVSELINLVAFLQLHYEMVERSPAR